MPKSAYLTDEEFEEVVEAFADADGGEQAIMNAIGGGKMLPEAKYRDLPEASKHWYRVRMQAAIDRYEETIQSPSARQPLSVH